MRLITKLLTNPPTKSRSAADARDPTAGSRPIHHTGRPVERSGSPSPLGSTRIFAGDSIAGLQGDMAKIDCAPLSAQISQIRAGLTVRDLHRRFLIASAGQLQADDRKVSTGPRLASL
jgi:hypothetical protein